MSERNRFLERLQRHFTERRDDICCQLITHQERRTLAWRDVEALAGRFTATYCQAGLKSGDAILIFVRHRAELYGSFFGAMLGGFIPSFMPCTSPRQAPAIYWRSHQVLLERTRPGAIVADTETFAEMEQGGLMLGNTRRIVCDQIGPETATSAIVPEHATALLQHSSGTTGLKKGVTLSYDAIVAQIETYARALSVRPQADVIVSWLPLYHDMGLIACCIMPAFLGIPVIHIDPFAWIAKPTLLFECIVEFGGTLVWLPNFAFEHLATVAGQSAERYDLSGIRAFINCSEPCKTASFDRFAAAFAASKVRQDQLQCCYAMAETVFAVCQTRLGSRPQRVRLDPGTLNRGMVPLRVADHLPGTELVETGTPLAEVEIAVYDQQRQRLPDPTVGEIGIRAPFLFSGYNKDEERTAARLVGGTYFTGDIGFLLDGRLHVLGRIDDVIIVNGRNLYAHEVEAALGGIEGLKRGRSIAVGSFDARLGSANLIIISERRRTSARLAGDLRRDIMQTVLSIFDVVPRSIHIVEEGWLIKTTSGKISRIENLARFDADMAKGATMS